MHFYIDPGHRNSTYDFGATAFGEKESVLALSISKKLGNALHRLGHKITYSRESENDVLSLTTRVNKANALSNLDYYISIHINCFKEEAANGFEIFHYGSLEGLSKKICDQVCGKTYQINRGEKPNQTFYVLRATKAKSILIECGFISNKRELELLTSEEGQNQIVEGILEGFGLSLPKLENDYQLIIDGVEKNITFENSALAKALVGDYLIIPKESVLTGITFKN